MRRSEREITDLQKIRQIILACDCCRLGFADGDGVYIVPLNFGYAEERGKRIFYFHSAMEGRKLELIRKCGRVGFEMDTNHQLKWSETACGYSFAYQSVIGEGTVRMIEVPGEKRAALERIMGHYTGREHWEIPEASLSGVALFQLEADHLSCKEHL